MKNLTSKITIALLLSASLFGCQKKEIESRYYPRLRTQKVTDISPEGATFRGEVLTTGNSPVLEYGFLWSTQEYLSFSYAEHIQINEKFSSGDFQCRIDFSLIKDQKYYLKSYVKTKDLTIFGNVVEFVSNGSQPPNIQVFSPVTGFWGDTIAVSGERFSTLDNKVFFGDLEAKVVTHTDSLIHVLIPKAQNKETVDIKVSVNNNSTISTETFQYKTPEIHHFSPRIASIGDTITVSGKNFDPRSENTHLYFGQVKSDIVFLADTVVKSIVPHNLEKAENELTIVSDSFRVSSSEPFSLPPLKIDGFSPDKIKVISSDMRLTIYGQGFSPNPESNTVLFEGNELIVDKAWSDSLKVNIPRNLFPSNPDDPHFLIGAIKVKLPFRTAVSDKQLQIINYGQYSWNPCQSFPGGGRLDAVAFSLNGKGYIGTGMKDEEFETDKYFSDFWEYDPQSDTWTRINDLPGNPRAGATAMKINGNVYVGLGSSDINNEKSYLNDWYRFNPSDGSWTRLNDFPDNGRYGAFTFNSGDINLLGGGVEALNSQEERYSWVYEPASDSWDQNSFYHLPYSMPRTESKAISIDNTGYVFVEDRIYVFENYGWRYYYYYFDDSRTKGSSAFALNGKGYRALSYAGDENPEKGSNSILVVDFNRDHSSKLYFPASRRTNVATFTIGNSAYIVGGTTYDNGKEYFNDVYELQINE